MASGIYSITNKEDGKRYIGRSVDISRRKRDHLKALREGKNSSRHLQLAWNKWGEESFIFEIVEECPPEDIVQREAHWIQTYETTHPDKGYNLKAEDGSGSWCLTDAAKQHLSEIRVEWHKHHPERSEVYRERAKQMHESSGWRSIDKRTPDEREVWLQTQRTEEIRRLRSENAKKSKLSESLPWTDERREEWRQKFSGEGNPCYGKPLPEERKQKISESLMGKPAPKPPGFGEKIAEARRKYWAERKAKVQATRDSCDE
jgi:group I intron endonuclease